MRINRSLQDVLPWLAPAILAVHVKQVMLYRGYWFVAQQLGRTKASELTYWEKSSFYRSDLLVGFILIPIALLLMTRWMPPRLRVAIIAASSMLCLLCLYIELQCQYGVGRFLSFPLLLKGFNFAWHDGSWWNARRQTRQVPAGRHDSLIPMMIALSLGLAWALLWLPRIPNTPYHESALLAGLNTFAGLDTIEKVDDREFRDLSAGQLIERYNQLVHAPVPRNSPYSATAKGSDVILFVFETGPAQCLPGDDDWPEFPNLRRLRENSFVGAITPLIPIPHAPSSLSSVPATP